MEDRTAPCPAWSLQRHTSPWGRHEFSITLHVSPRCNQSAPQSGTAKHGSPEGPRGTPRDAAAAVAGFSCSLWFFQIQRGTWGQQEETLQWDEHHDSGLFKNIHTHTIYMHMCVFLMHILICSVRHMCLHGGVSSINGFTVQEEGCCLGEGKAVPRGMCEYVCSLKSAIPVVSFVPCKEPWLSSVPGLRCRWSLGQRNSIPQLTTTGFYSSRSDKSTKIKLKQKNVPASSFLLNCPSGVISPGAKATPPARRQ